MQLTVTDTDATPSESFSPLISQMACSLLDSTETICVTQDSLAHRIYQQERITERFNCSYGLNEAYQEAFQDSPLQFSGMNPDGAVRIIELPEHPFFLAMLFQPQLSSSAAKPHPVIIAYLRAIEVFAAGRRD